MASRLQDGKDYRFQFAHHIDRPEPDYVQALAAQPYFSALIALWFAAKLMAKSIHFNDEPHGRTIEIDDASADGMLAAELESSRPFAQFEPKQSFRKRQVAPESPSPQHGFIPFTWRRHLPLHHPAEGSPPHLSMGRN